ncbi:hypothetical protein RRG08_017803 [Elysia crispata]|uniref:Uncharacterized protein n=1 Tax=Elysia crispata TaxID=231223 RepID=A0AAE0YE81_9GAST|nr:hypothetical protein RRG08_017803 [Elysia crispata]
MPGSVSAIPQFTFPECLTVFQPFLSSPWQNAWQCFSHSPAQLARMNVAFHGLRTTGFLVLVKNQWTQNPVIYSPRIIPRSWLTTGSKKSDRRSQHTVAL